MNEVLRLKKLETDAKLKADLVALLNHPVYSVLIAFVVVEYLQSKGLMGNIAGTTLEGGLITSDVLSSLAKSGALADLAKIGGEAAKLAPLVLAAGG